MQVIGNTKEVINNPAAHVVRATALPTNTCRW